MKHEEYMAAEIKKYVHTETSDLILETPEGSRYVVNPEFEANVDTVRDLADEELLGNIKKTTVFTRKLRSLNYPDWEK